MAKKRFERILYSCRDCPNLATPQRKINFCLAMERLIENFHTEEFPDWCPQEDYA